MEDTIRVGILGTNPVFIYSINTGMKRRADSIKNKIENREKNFNGL